MWKCAKIVTRYTKRGQGLTNEEKRVSEPISIRRAGLEDHQPWARENTIEKGIDATTLEQLLKQIENLKIAMVMKSEVHPSSSKYMNRKCIWCNNTKHDWQHYDEHKEALRRDLIYYEGNWIHLMDSQKSLRPNFRKGGMKKVLEEEMVERSNYTTTAGMRVGETPRGKSFFWPKVLEISEKTDFDETRIEQASLIRSGSAR